MRGERGGGGGGCDGGEGRDGRMDTQGLSPGRLEVTELVVVSLRMRDRMRV